VGMRNVDYKRARRFEVDLSALRNILEIDAERMVARVEPLVSMAQITKATCPMNLSLAVAPELDDLTVGGLINGYGISGSSHVYGLFSDTVVSMEVVLADGQVVRATMDNEHSDLFYGMPWSQGTIGLLVSAEIRLVRVKEYMRPTYTPVRGMSALSLHASRLQKTSRCSRRKQPCPRSYSSNRAMWRLVGLKRRLQLG
jgi:Delta24-sterol reductase